MNKLKSYMYDRNNCCASEAGKIVAFAKDYFDSKGAQFCYTLSRVLELDTQTVSMYLAKYYVDNYDYVNQRPLNLSFTNSTKAVVIYLSWLLICILVRVMPRGRPSSSRFIRFLLDKVEFSNEVSRFEKLFAGSTESVAAITTREDLKHSFQNYGMASKYADQIPILGLISLSLRSLTIVAKYSIRDRVDYNTLVVRLLKNYFNALSDFAEFKASFLVYTQHYNSCPVRNYIFKKMTNGIVVILQKNIIQLGKNGFFIDSDVLVSLNSDSCDRVEFLGGRFNDAWNLGSFFMYSLYFNPVEKLGSYDGPQFDVLFMGQNVHAGIDNYSQSYADYYQCFKWLKELKEKFPELKIGIKHHNNNLPDPIEEEILRDTEISVYRSEYCSYQMGLNADVVVGFGSSIVFELVGHGKKAVLMNPAGRNSQFLFKRSEYNAIGSENIEQFLLMVERIHDIDFESYRVEYSVKRDSFCVDSGNFGMTFFNNCNEYSNK